MLNADQELVDVDFATDGLEDAYGYITIPWAYGDSQIGDGDYEIQLKTVCDGIEGAPNEFDGFSPTSITGTIDRIAPKQYGLPKPADILWPGEEISIYFTEAIECEHPYRFDLEVTVDGVDRVFDNDNLLVMCKQNQISFTFDMGNVILDHLMGKNIHIKLGRVRDLAGNKLLVPVEHTLQHAEADLDGLAVSFQLELDKDCSSLASGEEDVAAVVQQEVARSLALMNTDRIDVLAVSCITNRDVLKATVNILPPENNSNQGWGQQDSALATPTLTSAPIAITTTASTEGPTNSPTAQTQSPTTPSTIEKTSHPTARQTERLTSSPTAGQTHSPTSVPSIRGTASPTGGPTSGYTSSPTAGPTESYTSPPTVGAGTLSPSFATTTSSPSEVAGGPTSGYTSSPTAGPTESYPSRPAAGAGTLSPSSATTTSSPSEATGGTTSGHTSSPTAGPTESYTSRPAAGAGTLSPSSATATSSPSSEATDLSLTPSTSTPTADPSPPQEDRRLKGNSHLHSQRLYRALREESSQDSKNASRPKSLILSVRGFQFHGLLGRRPMEDDASNIGVTADSGTGDDDNKVTSDSDLKQLLLRMQTEMQLHMQTEMQKQAKESAAQYEESEARFAAQIEESEARFEASEARFEAFIWFSAVAAVVVVLIVSRLTIMPASGYRQGA